MSWIQEGALVVGTPENQLPRIADEEMPGLQLILHGFYIDVFPYPNEEGALPLTNVTQAQAAKLCQDRGKRPCTEIEWERACKGPDNRIHAYGDDYRAEACATGANPKLYPSGFRAACRSDFGVYDLHGGIWEWTASLWGRGEKSDRVSLRGGNSIYGPVVGRCANARPREPDSPSGIVGFRCCAGPENPDQVKLDVGTKRGIEGYRMDPQLLERLTAELPKAALKELQGTRDFRIIKTWYWRPVGNDELVILAGCAPKGKSQQCGLLVGRSSAPAGTALSWVGSGHWFPSLHAENDPRDVWMLGGDERGRFKRRLAYAWGEVRVGDKDWRVPKLPKKVKKKGR